MRLLGIDYGTKRIGIAVGNVEQGIAFPKEVLPNDEHILDRIRSIIESEGIEGVVIGIPQKFSGKASELVPKIHAFAEKITQASGLDVFFENEVFSTKAIYPGSTERKRVDAAAASLILQSYIDRVKKNF